MRLRLRFAKTEDMRYIGHLDVYRTLERTVRRAGLPLAYSNGFTQRAKLTLASALPLGLTSEEELADFWLAAELPVEEIKAALLPALPPGILLLELWQAPEKAPPLQTQLAASEFAGEFVEPIPGLPEKIEALLAAPQILREKRGKLYDLRPQILRLTLYAESTQPAALRMLLTALPNQTGRPEELLSALGIPAENCRLRRTRLVFQEQQELV